jgi:hypothetical protein
MLANGNGFKKAAHMPKIKNGLVRMEGVANPMRVLMLNEQTSRYDLVLEDCFGTDQCEGSYVWTVIEKTQSDGYSYEINYKNYLNPGEKLPTSK